MQAPSTLKPPNAASAKGRLHAVRKSHGVHYTPSDLAGFVARRVLAQVYSDELAVLDPACGDGELLLALATEAVKAGLPSPHLVGVDRDNAALAVARKRLANVPGPNVTLCHGDFLAKDMGVADSLPVAYDAIISNPPYVRTQVLGAARARALARQFGLTGRVDLYHAFVAAMTTKLKQGGVLGLLCSNRFLTTQGGRSLRSLLLDSYEIKELWDLGDTKLFEAAVLPAVLIARRGGPTDCKNTAFIRVYEEEDTSTQAAKGKSLIAEVENGRGGPIRVGSRRFNIERGRLAESTSGQRWWLASPSGSRWLEQVRKRSAGRFGDLGPIRVGIKTTADSVFIRPSWDDLPKRQRPEPELLRPLLTHRVAGRWRATESTEGMRTVLYPHEMSEGHRRAVDLAHYPRAAVYLKQHQARLTKRDYVRQAGRAWYEIWVPQQPDVWIEPKLVWPDISDRPRFFLDLTGAIVNGDCYWLSCSGQRDEEIALALAVANSTFALRHYDMFCGNRLYAGRRRFITQYLEDLPMPNAGASELDEVTSMVNELREMSKPHTSAHAIAIEVELDHRVSELFGVKEVAR